MLNIFHNFRKIYKFESVIVKNNSNEGNSVDDIVIKDDDFNKTDKNLSISNVVENNSNMLEYLSTIVKKEKESINLINKFN